MDEVIEEHAISKKQSNQTLHHSSTSTEQLKAFYQNNIWWLYYG